MENCINGYMWETNVLIYNDTCCDDDKFIKNEINYFVIFQFPWHQHSRFWLINTGNKIEWMNHHDKMLYQYEDKHNLS